MSRIAVLGGYGVVDTIAVRTPVEDHTVRGGLHNISLPIKRDHSNLRRDNE